MDSARWIRNSKRVLAAVGMIGVPGAAVVMNASPASAQWYNVAHRDAPYSTNGVAGELHDILFRDTTHDSGTQSFLGLISPYDETGAVPYGRALVVVNHSQSWASALGYIFSRSPKSIDTPNFTSPTVNVYASIGTDLFDSVGHVF